MRDPKGARRDYGNWINRFEPFKTSYEMNDVKKNWEPLQCANVNATGEKAPGKHSTRSMCNVMDLGTLEVLVKHLTGRNELLAETLERTRKVDTLNNREGSVH